MASSAGSVIGLGPYNESQSSPTFTLCFSASYAPEVLHRHVRHVGLRHELDLDLLADRLQTPSSSLARSCVTSNPSMIVPQLDGYLTQVGDNKPLSVLQPDRISEQSAC